MKFKILLGITITIISFTVVLMFSLVHGADYGNDVFVEEVEEDYTYYKISCNNQSYHCKRYKLENGKIIMYDVFMEDDNEKYSEIIILQDKNIEYIKKRKAISQDDVVKSHRSDCFINTARGK